MHLPEHIRELIRRRVEAVSFSALRRAAEEISAAYRTGDAGRLRQLPPDARVAAYLVTRMPATYAAAMAVLSDLRRRLGGARIRSLLDAGAGAGAATLAARAQFPELTHLTLLEPDGQMTEAGRDCLPEAVWVPRDLRRAEALPERDLVLASYTLGELAETEALEVAERLWRAATVALVIIEPGTPRGFALVRTVRDRLLAAGARMAAPCPAEGPCPLSGEDWCHFGKRVERSSLHRRVKGGDLGYEDEKFSYVALARKEATPVSGRIVRRPLHHPGLILLEVCRGVQVETLSVARKERESWRAARHAEWGETWGESEITA
ncbi:MAG TPA: small ribosomal subunit Rsm22 family protein [Bryobacteraceae bacterium]|nr:small ribosomal subunit Rsm22 family protein [Bryobacteraceae bacterium]